MNYEFKPTPAYREAMRNSLKIYCKPETLKRIILETTGKEQSVDNLDGNTLDSLFNHKDCSVLKPDGICESLVSENGVYKIPVSWTATAVIQIEADNLADAVERARNAVPATPLPKENVGYREDSFEIDVEEDEDAIDAVYYPASEVYIDKDGDTATPF